MNRSPKLLDLVRQEVRLQNKSLSTERIYCYWIKDYIIFNETTHPKKLEVNHIISYLTHLAEKRCVSPATQNSALNAIRFLYKSVLELDLKGLGEIRSVKSHKNLTEFLTVNEVLKVIHELEGVSKIIVSLIYGSGLTVKECVRLRVQDINLKRSQIFVHGRGKKDRWSILSLELHELLRDQINQVRKFYEEDIENGFGYVRHIEQMDVDNPKRTREWGLQWLFPAKKMSIDPRSGLYLRHHLLSDGVTKNINKVLKKSGIDKRISSKYIRAAFATHLMKQGYDVRTVQSLLGHKHVETTMQYDLSLFNNSAKTLISPLEDLQ